MNERARAVLGFVRRVWRAPRTPAILTFAISFLVLAQAFLRNEDNAGKPDKPRGNGEYLPVLARGDGHVYYLMGRSLVFDGDLVLDNDLARFGDPWRQEIWPKTGHKYIPHPIGPALYWTPILIMADAGAALFNQVGAEIPRHGYTEWHQRIVLFTSVLYAVVAGLFGYLIARRWIGGRWGPLYAVVGVLFGTSLTYYSTYMPSYGHAMGAFFDGLFLWLWARGFGDLRWRRFAILGFVLGAAALVRTQEVGLGIVFVVEGVALLVRPPAGTGSRLRLLGALALRGGVVLGCLLVALLPQFISWHAVTGEWWHRAYGEKHVRLWNAPILDFLFSSRNGWFSTTPLAYAGVIGLCFVPKRARVVALGLGAALAIQVWLDAAILDWWSSASFGQRRMCSVTAILVVGLASLLRAAWIAASRLKLASARARRVRFGVAHALAFAAIGWFASWNWGWVSVLKAGKPAGRAVGAMPWGGIPGWQRAIARPIHDGIGNPFMFPANVLFHLEHGVPVRRYEEIVGEYVWNPPLTALRDGTYVKHREVWPLADRRRDRWVVEGFGPSRTEDRRQVRPVDGRRATALVPLLLPEAHRFTWPLAQTPGAAAQVTIRWNGDVVLKRDLPPDGRWLDATWDVPASDVSVGENELTIEAPPGVVRVRDLIVAFPP